uniref:DNA repair protein RAD2 n=1 Tax=Saccharomyces cerevisiae (strain ATCC 204508 / S288c) TaxID=559292 RepID=UPI00024ED265|nr:Chain B, DNA repair protein RAD2 [Saccharomyces cerevisiae S288C]
GSEILERESEKESSNDENKDDDLEVLSEELFEDVPTKSQISKEAEDNDSRKY